jgi:hypothetical protein
MFSAEVVTTPNLQRQQQRNSSSSSSRVFKTVVCSSSYSQQEAEQEEEENKAITSCMHLLRLSTCMEDYNNLLQLLDRQTSAALLGRVRTPVFSRRLTTQRLLYELVEAEAEAVPASCPAANSHPSDPCEHPECDGPPICTNISCMQWTCSVDTNVILSLSLSHDLLLLLLMQFRAWFSEEARIGKTLTGFQWRRRAA